MSSDLPKSDPKSKPEASNQPAGVPELDVPDYVSEDVYRFWKNNGSRILLYIAVILVAFIGTQVWKTVRMGREDSLKDAYSQLSSQEDKLAFAQKHAGHGIAGYVYMDAAADAVSAEKYGEAASFYEKAEKALRGSTLEGVAAINGASVLELAGDESAAVKKLDAIIEKVEFTKGIRAEAMFKRIALALKSGQDNVVVDLTTKLEAIDETGVWTQRLDGVKNYQ
jgi:predicted negative regulator of RcsB-dependent stress response